MAETLTAEQREWRAWAERNIPAGKQARKMRIIRISRKDAWYADMIGDTVDIHYFCSFGAWDTQGRWVDYYDVSFDLDEKPTLKSGLWWEVLEVHRNANREQIKRAYFLKAQIFHPDKTPFGNSEDFRRLKNAYDHAQKAIPA